MGYLPGHKLSLWSRLDSTFENDNFQFGVPFGVNTEDYQEGPQNTWQ